MADPISNVTVVQWGVVIGASLAAAVTDIKSRRIPNALTLPLLLSGLVYGLMHAGLPGLGKAVAACVVLALPYVLLFVFAGGGAGDAKMMGAVGAWLGLEAGLIVLACVAIVGGVMGLARIVAHRQRRTRLGNLVASLYVLALGLCTGREGWALLKSGPHDEEGREMESRGLTIPYGPAIFVGVCIGAGVVHVWMR